MHEAHAERICCGEQGEAYTSGAEHARQFDLGIAAQYEAHGRLLGALDRSPRMPASEEFLTPDEPQVRGGLVEVAVALEQPYEAKRAHYRHVGGTRQLRGVSVAAARSRQKGLGELGCEQDLEHPLVQIGVQICRLADCARSRGRTGGFGVEL